MIKLDPSGYEASREGFPDTKELTYHPEISQTEPDPTPYNRDVVSSACIVSLRDLDD